MKTLLFACLMSAGISCESAPSPTPDSDRLSLADRCIALAEKPAFDFPISRAIGMEVVCSLEPVGQPDNRVFSFSIAKSR